MPKVGKKEFSYSDKGKAKAKAYAEKTGQSIEKGSSPMAYESNDARNRSQVYREGGKVKKDLWHDVIKPFAKEHGIGVGKEEWKEGEPKRKEKRKAAQKESEHQRRINKEKMENPTRPKRKLKG